MRRLGTLTALIAAFLVALAGVAFADAEVTITDDGLDPSSVEADIREAIVWTNASDSDVSLVGEDPTWESGPIEPGATFSIEITKAGTYTYSSDDDSVSGEIVVGGGGEEDASDDEGNGNGNDGAGEPVEEIDPDAEALPETGINITVPGALSVLLIGLGLGLLAVTTSPRRLRRA